MASLIRRISCVAILPVLAACSGDDTSPGLGSDDAAADGGGSSRIDSGTSGPDAGVVGTGTDDAGPDGTVDDTGAPSGDDAATDSSMVMTMTGDAGDAGGGGEAGPDASVPAGLVLLYSFDEGSGTTAGDSSGHGHNGVVESADAGADAGTGWTSSGRTGAAIDLTGSQDVSVPSGVFTGVSDATITAWVRLGGLAGWSRIFDFGNGPPGTGDRWTFLTPAAGAGGPLQWNVYGGVPGDGSTREAVVTPGTELPLNVWKHVALTASAGAYRMYVDGFPAADLANGPVIALSEMEPLTPTSWLGKSRFGDPNLDGDIDDFRVYSRVLSSTEVENLAWPQHDYSSWRFDEGTGATTADSSDNANTGALLGGAAWTSSGRLGAALDLSGGAASATGPYVSLADNPLKNCTTSFTASVWVKVHAIADWSRLFEFATGTSSFTYLTPADGSGKPHFAMVAPAGIFDLVAANPYPTDQAWHHLAVTVASNGDATLYLDGASIASANSPDVGVSSFTSVSDGWIGRSHFVSTDPYLNASVDEFRVSCRAYTADEIKNLAHGP
jgi:Concanavalin A-like lectin/glucanases superfamily